MQPNAEEFSRLIESEEAKRDRCADKLQRWQAIQATIAWAEQQRHGGRNRKENRLREQREKLAALRASQSEGSGSATQ